MYVYWIKAAHHVNPKTEGYIGVSSNPLARYSKHKKVNINPKLKNAFDKYDTQLVVLHEGNDKWCYNKEQEYRPNENIGWNIRPGGQYHVHTDAIKQKISDTHKRKGTNPYSIENTHSPQAIAKRRAKMIEKKWYHNPLNPDQRTLANTCPVGWVKGKIPQKPKKIRGEDYICNVSSWKLTDPDGIEHSVYNLKKWCQDMGFPYLGSYNGKTWRQWYIKKL